MRCTGVLTCSLCWSVSGEGYLPVVFVVVSQVRCTGVLTCSLCCSVSGEVYRSPARPTDSTDVRSVILVSGDFRSLSSVRVSSCFLLANNVKT